MISAECMADDGLVIATLPTEISEPAHRLLAQPLLVASIFNAYFIYFLADKVRSECVGAN